MATRERKTFIYFIQAGTSGPIKIGRTDNVRKRASELQVGHHETLYVLGYYKAVPSEEAVWHKRFSHLSLRGEWFRPEPDLLVEINEMILLGGKAEFRPYPDWLIRFTGRILGIPNLADRPDWMLHVQRLEERGKYLERHPEEVGKPWKTDFASPTLSVEVLA